MPSDDAVNRFEALARVNNVVVPLDGSEYSGRALPVAVDLARRLHADLHLLSAVAKEDEVAERDAQLAAIDVPAPAVFRSVVVDLDPAGAIHETLRRVGDAVAVMASHGRGRSAALVGSVATDVVARGHDPLVVGGPFIEEPLLGSGVVACIDDSPSSVALLPVALRWAQLLNEPLTVITVAEPIPPPVRPGPTRRRFGPGDDVGAFLEWLVRPLRDQGNEVATEAVWDPVSVADGVLSYLEEHPASLTVIGSHARSGLARIVFGSTAAAVVHGSTSPVLVVPRVDGGRAKTT
jgi:nucleotide-binding universal stress UspA family protein